jgi:hypothetical protein
VAIFDGLRFLLKHYLFQLYGGTFNPMADKNDKKNAKKIIEAIGLI